MLIETYWYLQKVRLNLFSFEILCSCRLLINFTFKCGHFCRISVTFLKNVCLDWPGLRDQGSSCNGNKKFSLITNTYNSLYQFDFTIFKNEILLLAMDIPKLPYDKMRCVHKSNSGISSAFLESHGFTRHMTNFPWDGPNYY